LNVDQVQSVNELLPKLRTSSQLVRLDLASTGLKDADLKAISQIPHLLTLDLRDNAITDQGFSELAKSPSLTDVWLSGTRLTPRCIETIQKMPHLRTITILLNSWSPKERADFISAAKKVHCQVSNH
jgi:Leucine-rich repeat (LRR) protein